MELGVFIRYSGLLSTANQGYTVSVHRTPCPGAFPSQPFVPCRTALCRTAGPLGYSLYGEIETKTKFWGKTIDCILAGHVSLRLKGHDEEYRWGRGPG